MCVSVMDINVWRGKARTDLIFGIESVISRTVLLAE